MKVFALTTVCAALALGGCASQGDYKQYLDAQTRIETQNSAARSAEATAKYNAEAEKYKAMAAIAASGSESAKVAAVVAMMGMGQGTSPIVRETRTQIQAPPQNEALAWASVLVPSVTNVIGMGYNYRATVATSNNARDVAVSTNSTFASMGSNIQNTATSMGGMIQSPQANVTTTISGDGVVGAGTLTKSPVTTTTTDNHATTDNHTTNPTTVTPAGVLCTINAAGDAIVCN